MRTFQALDGIGRRLAHNFIELVEVAVGRHFAPCCDRSGFIQILVEFVRFLDASAHIREILTDATFSKKGGFVANVIARHGLANPEFLGDISRCWVETNLLGVAVNATCRGVDFLSSHG